ncbi:MAG: crossover junction endodeoxyribonuclease RuvC [Thermodesulfobacteriota bacterium]
MRVLGVDPGSAVCGYGIIEDTGDGLVHIESGTIDVPRALLLPSKLKTVFDGLRVVIERSRPTCMSIENVFFARNARSSLKLGEARGVAILAAAMFELPVYEYAPTQVKLAVTGKGRANKTEVGKILTILFNREGWEKTDASDAVAIAVCHIHMQETKNLLGGHTIRSRGRRRRFRANDFPS